MRSISLNLITICVLIKMGWSYRNYGHSSNYGQNVPGSFDSVNRNNGNCPQPQPFPADAEQVTDNVAYECLPSYIRNPNAVFDEDDGTIEWLGGRQPDYSLVNEMFNRERTIVHPRGSIEDRISNLMKNWDKEVRYKQNPRQWVSVVPDNFYMTINGGSRLTLAEIGEQGSYNVFLGNSEFYSRDYINASASNEAFRVALKSGFALEVLKVYSPPPTVAFKFRHWGHMTGPLRCPMRNGTWLDAPPHGGKVEFFGDIVLHINEKYQILSIDTTFRGDTLMEQMVLGNVVNTPSIPNRVNIESDGNWYW